MCEKEYSELSHIIFRMNGRAYHTSWYTNEEGVDRFKLNEYGKILSFADEEEFEAFAQQNDLHVSCEKVTISIERLKNLNFQALDCDQILLFWNMMTDAASSLNLKFLGDRRAAAINQIYNKLFYGTNPPALRGDEAEFVPRWKRREQRTLCCVIHDGLQLLKRALG